MRTKEKKRINSTKAQRNVITSKSQSVKKKPVAIKKKPVSVSKRKPAESIKKRVGRSRRPSIKMKSKVKRNKNGHILAGSGSNGGGRPKGSIVLAKLSELQAAITRVELSKSLGKKGKKLRAVEKWIDYQIKKSYTDTSLAIAILARLYPALKSIEQVSFASDAMDDTEAASIRAELQKRCKTVLQNAERKSKS